MGMYSLLIQFFERYILQVLIFHIACGCFALLISFIDGVYTMFTVPRAPSSDTQSAAIHRILWSIFHGAMGGVSISAIILSIVRVPVNYFLLSVAFFVLYMIVTASRSLFGSALRQIDKVFAAIMFAIGVIMVSYGGYIAMSGGVVEVSLLLFGAIGTLFSISDLRRKIGTPIAPRFLGRNFGALIAAITAFLVVNINLPGALQIFVWIAPTAVLTPMIAYLYRVYRYARPASLLSRRIRYHLVALWNEH